MLMEKERIEIVEYGKKMSSAGQVEISVFMIRKPDIWLSVHQESDILKQNLKT